MSYRILGWSHKDGWHDIGEGPWDDEEGAVRFADSEVGIPWIVVDSKLRVVTFGDNYGEHRED